ncbi:MAG: hypothetical protein QOE61_211, partial [Micromonosporaceae bacterium]|nr:hypothetical protein [Micromonosporaceae bacterium]
DDADAFFRALFAAIDPQTRFPEPLPPALLAYAERSMLATRWPWEAAAPIDALRAARIPVLVVSGGQRPLFEAISDSLADRLRARRAVVPGGHGTQNAGGPFNALLEEFLRQRGEKP